VLAMVDLVDPVAHHRGPAVHGDEAGVDTLEPGFDPAPRAGEARPS
jgi:hypothetical protein